MKEIELSRGAVALVDDADFEWLTERGSWHLDGRGNHFYAIRNFWTDDGKCRKERMHRLLLPDAEIVDHINGNTLDNQRTNLRPATWTENARNRRLRSDSRTGFKGVSRKGSSRYGASIFIDGAHQYLGTYSTAEDAARAYDAAAVDLFGEFASPNFQGGASDGLVRNDRTTQRPAELR